MRNRRNRGFGLVTSIFVLVVLATSSLAMISLSGVQRRTASLSLQALRADQAARSGLQWAIYNAIGSGTCPASTTLTLTEGGLQGFSATVSCASTTHVEAATTSTIFELDAVGEYGAFGSADYVRQHVRASLHQGS
ncbi:MAG: pilus assembly protein MshP [bacterium]|nr:pilus assembly protein MshP [bacterium]MCP5066753.1 pilus assembly protein MshP [bacterium]